MNKSHLVHVAWAAVAAAAFAIGSKKSDSPEASSDRDGPRSSRSPSSRATGSRGGELASGRNGSSRRRPRTDDLSSGDEFGPGQISEAEIRQLGLDFKAARGPLERREVFSEILKNLTAENARLMREQIAHLDTDSPEFREFHYAWGSVAGEEAVLHGAETPERDMATTLAGWAAYNPDAALAYFNGLDEKERNSSGLKWGAVYGLVDADPNLAVRFAIEQKAAGDKEASRLMDVVARQVLRSGDPADAASWASTLPAGEMQDTAVSRVAREYADEDPVATLNWANTLPEGAGRSRAVRESFSEWARADPRAAADRLSAMTDSPERDQAALGFATRVAWEDPQVGIQWANTIADNGTRTRALIESGRAYFRKDPEGAKQWLAGSGLSKEQQQDVTRRR